MESFVENRKKVNEDEKVSFPRQNQVQSDEERLSIVRKSIYYLHV